MQRGKRRHDWRLLDSISVQRSSCGAESEPAGKRCWTRLTRLTGILLSGLRQAGRAKERVVRTPRNVAWWLRKVDARNPAVRCRYTKARRHRALLVPFVAQDWVGVTRS